MSSGLYFLKSNDFQISKGSKGNVLSLNITGFSLVLFYSTQCPHCKTLIPIFKSLPSTTNGCQFGMINVQQNKQVVLMSRDTIAAVQVVPYIVFYVHGKPYMRYHGPYEKSQIVKFIVEMAKKVKSKQFLTKDDPNIKHAKQTGRIPQYSVGRPLYGDEDVCYLQFGDAYGHKQAPPGQDVIR